jgi:DNA-binding CsgD family transcriptional regulator
MMDFDEFEDYLMHEGRSITDGAPVGSGRYPRGSGENPYQHDGSFIGAVKKLREQGLTDKQIAKSMDMNTSQFRAKMSIEKNAQRAANASRAQKLYDKGYGYTEIGRQMGVNESTVRSWLQPTLSERAMKTTNVANALKEAVDKKKYVDIGAGTETYMGISRERLKTAVAQLKSQGYQTGEVWVEQMGTGKKTDILVLYGPDTTYQDVQDHKYDIKLVTDYTEDNGRTMKNMEPPRSVDSKRLQVVYAEDGGGDKDGVIELRRGCEDLNLGGAAYAQVRIAVDGTHYLKGMAIYKDEMPDGVDIIFNTSKHKDVPIKGEKDHSVLKPLKDDPDNPFGATIKNDEQLRYIQKHYIDKNGKEQLSCLNIVNEQGAWEDWSRNLSSQFLSKQSPDLAKRQLDLAYKKKLAEYDQYDQLTNPVVKKYFLDRFADSCDSDAVYLKAAAMPRQSTSVILPIPSLKDNEVYAPNYKNGEEVILIRHPHAGTFEIPRLIVNNNNKDGKSVIGNSEDAIGINPHVAAKLSGADFDGDSVIVIPTKGQKLKSSSTLKGLEGFDPKEAYPAYEGMPKMKKQTKQTQMGIVSNLITDMTLKGADEDELARAVRHSMVIIDAEKHNLNYKQSEKDNGIAELKKKYQDHGASTLISQAKGIVRIPERENRVDVDPETGKKIYYTKPNNTYTVTKVNKRTGEVTTKEKQRTEEIYKMEYVDDARTLSSGTRMENIYADFANSMKALGNRARKESISTKTIKRNPSAVDTYRVEVASLNEKLNVAMKNRPLERQAQLIANQTVNMTIKANPDIKNDKDHLKRLKGQALDGARHRVGANKKSSSITITPREWEAIQAGAVSPTQLTKILNNTNMDHVRQLATPRVNYGLPASKVGLARQMRNNGYTTAEIADSLGVSTTTVNKALRDTESGG